MISLICINLMRKLKKEECDLIVFMLRGNSDYSGLCDTLFKAVIKEMNDGRMGSIRFIYSDSKVRKFSKEIAEASILDVDNVLMSFTINIDEYGDLFELDVFKVDFSPMKQFPKPPYKVIPSKST